MEPEKPWAGHLDDNEVAAYLDGTVGSRDQVRLETHLATCAHCRSEMVAVARIVRDSPRLARRYVPAGIAAAAAALLLIARPWGPSSPATAPEPAFRETGSTEVSGPAAIAPRGPSASAQSFVWSRVPVADHYRLTVVDTSGSVLWETQTADTSAVAPIALPLKPGANYFWKVEAQTRWDHWVASELVEFSVTRPKS